MFVTKSVFLRIPYLVPAVVFCLFVLGSARAQTFSTVVTYNGSNGSEPSSLLEGANGDLWLTTSAGGKYNYGVLDEINLDGKLDRISTFRSEVDAALETLGSDGNYYGVNFLGGANNGGTVFRLTSKKVLTTLYSFTLDGPQGSGPLGLVQGSDGNFYGACYGGGSADSYGTLFKMTGEGSVTALYTFDFTHGAQPYAGPIEGTDGDFYGTTYSGGAYGVGTVYRITPAGKYTLLHSFGEHTDDPDFPVTPLVEGTDGNFYGATPYGGPDNYGSIFKITPGGSLTVLHNFAGTDGRWPGPMVLGSDGSIYGTTAYGGASGANGNGTIFQITSSGGLTTLYSFDGSDGTNPGGLIQDTSGTFYGETGGGGDLPCDPTYGCGTVFSLALGLPSFVESMPMLGSVGTTVLLVGEDLTGATKVTFNDTPAAFTVVSSHEITTSVPIGAATGSIVVTTRKGSASSYPAFTVLD